MKCRWRTDKDIGRWFFPQCMGGAVYGEYACTCQDDEKTFMDRVEKLENDISEIKSLLTAREE